MLSKFSRAYPLRSVFVWSSLLAVLYLLYRWFLPEGHVLPGLSGAAFLFAGTFHALLLWSALYVERSVRSDPPLWRMRYALALALFFFVGQVVVTGTELPSTEAVMQLGAGLVFGAFMARLVRHDERVVGDGAFDLERPLWTTRTGGLISTYAGFALVGVALLVALFAPNTRTGIFTVILLSSLMMPLVPKDRQRWSASDVVALSGTAALMVGLFGPG